MSKESLMLWSQCDKQNLNGNKLHFEIMYDFQEVSIADIIASWKYQNKLGISISIFLVANWHSWNHHYILCCARGCAEHSLKAMLHMQLMDVVWPPRIRLKFQATFPYIKSEHDSDDRHCFGQLGWTDWLTHNPWSDLFHFHLYFLSTPQSRQSFNQ